MTFKIAVLPGDGIGPEVTAEAVACLDAVARRTGLALEFGEAQIGGCAIDAEGTALPPATLEVAVPPEDDPVGRVGHGLPVRSGAARSCAAPSYDRGRL